MCNVMRAEFSCNFFLLRFHKPEAFCESQWRWPRIVFVLYRLVMSGYSIFAFTHMVVLWEQSENAPHSIMVFLTTWTYLVETLFFLVGSALALLLFLRPDHFQSGTCKPSNLGLECLEKSGQPPAAAGRNKINGYGGKQNGVHVNEALDTEDATTRTGLSNKSIPGDASSRTMDLESSAVREPDGKTPLPWYIQVYWCLANIIQVFAIMVTIIYFSALFSPDGAISLMDVNVHGINTAMIVIDVAICARPVRLLHGLYPMLYGFTYVVFSVIYWSQDREKNVLYQYVLDWNSPGLTTGVILGLTVIGIPFMQLVQFGVYKLRLRIYQKIYEEPYM